MKIFKCLNFIVLLTFSSLTWAATPVGSWQLSTTTQLELTSPTTGKKIKSKPINGFEFATFNDDGSYVSSEWINKIGIMLGSSTSQYIPTNFYGQWQNQSSTSYSVIYDKYLVTFPDSKFGITNTAFFDRIGINKLLATGFGGTPTFDSIQIVSYFDTGNFITGKSVKGTKKIVLNALWKNNNSPISTNITLTETYTGKPFIQSSCCGTDATQNKIDSDKFIADVSKLQGVQTTATGLKYVVLQDSLNADTPKAPSDTVIVNYRGFLPSGIIFDSNSSYEFKLKPADVTPGVIDGWVEGLQLMKKNAKFRFFIPSTLAYKENGSSPKIPGNSALIFDIELLSITPPAKP